MTIADDLGEQERLTEVYGRLRLKLLDLSKKNRMLNYNLGNRSKRHLQIVDEVMDEIYKKLAGDDATLRIEPLDEPEDVPPEEKTEEFIGALEHAKVSNLEYLTKLEALESAGRDDELALAKLERELRDHIRSEFGFSSRPKKAEINRADLARQAGIDPNFELGPVKTKASHSDGALQTLKFPDELDRIMGKIVADAKLAEQEMGISTLFLSFGFLEWYESDVSDKKAFAPLLLLPVTVDVKKSNTGKTPIRCRRTRDRRNQTSASKSSSRPMSLFTASCRRLKTATRTVSARSRPISTASGKPSRGSDDGRYIDGWSSAILRSVDLRYTRI